MPSLFFSSPFPFFFFIERTILHNGGSRASEIKKNCFAQMLWWLSLALSVRIEMVPRTHVRTHARTQAHTHTHTSTHTHMSTQAHKHTSTQAHKHTHSPSVTHTHTYRNLNAEIEALVAGERGT